VSLTQNLTKHLPVTRSRTWFKNFPLTKQLGPMALQIESCKEAETAVDMIYLYMLIIWQVENYFGAWASALMQPIYKRKDRHSPIS